MKKNKKEMRKEKMSHSEMKDHKDIKKDKKLVNKMVKKGCMK